MSFRDRVKELRRVRAADLQPHPKNWRTHGKHQQSVLRGVLQEVGFAGAVLARELPDGSLQLLDGHLRAETVHSAKVPVLVLDLDDAEAERLLLTHDPIASLAGVDEAKLADLLGRAATEHEAVGELLERLGRQVTDESLLVERPEVRVPVCYQVVVEVDGEEAQQAMYERLRGEGLRCRVLTI